MLHIYPIILETLADLRPQIAQIERRDSDLTPSGITKRVTRQLRRAAVRIGANVGEGMYSRGKNRQARYHTALGSAREVLSCLEIAHAFGYVPALDPVLVAKLNRIIGTLVRLVGR